MLFLPIGCLIFILFILALPALFILGYFHIVTLGFERLGIPGDITLLLLLGILIGSAFNIPIGKKKVFMMEKRALFGLFRSQQPQVEGLAVNVGGALIPFCLSLYFLFLIWQKGVDLQLVGFVVLLMVVLAKFLARVVPGKGISLPAFIPPIFSALLALVFVPQFAAPVAFIAGTLGVLIGADLLNLAKAKRIGGFVSIGGAGVFDGIFLVGIISALLAGF